MKYVKALVTVESSNIVQISYDKYQNALKKNKNAYRNEHQITKTYKYKNTSYKVKRLVAENGHGGKVYIGPHEVVKKTLLTSPVKPLGRKKRKSTDYSSGLVIYAPNYSNLIPTGHDKYRYISNNGFKSYAVKRMMPLNDFLTRQAENPRSIIKLTEPDGPKLYNVWGSAI